MRIEHLRYLVTIAELGSINKAAKHLFISQQGLSHVVQQLEKRHNVVLLARKSNKVYITEAGDLRIVFYFPDGIYFYAKINFSVEVPRLLLHINCRH